MFLIYEGMVLVAHFVRGGEFPVVFVVTVRAGVFHQFLHHTRDMIVLCLREQTWRLKQQFTMLLFHIIMNLGLTRISIIISIITGAMRHLFNLDVLYVFVFFYARFFYICSLLRRSI